VNPTFFSKMKIDKGLMTLVDEKRQKELVEGLAGIQHKRACGGSAANTVIAVAQYGGKSFYSCKVASDETGDFYYRDLVESQVATNWGEGRESGTTGKCLVMITPDADRTMNTFLGSTAQFSKKEIIEKELVNAEYLYVEGYLVASDSAREAAISARQTALKN